MMPFAAILIVGMGVVVAFSGEQRSTSSSATRCRFVAHARSEVRVKGFAEPVAVVEILPSELHSSG